MKLRLKITITLMSVLISLASNISGQQYKVQSGKVAFSIQAPASALTAETDSLTGSVDCKSGSISFTVHVPGFKFTSADMPELMRTGATYRFHHYYFNSDQYPLATFKGNAAALKKIDCTQDGVYEISCEGLLTMHATTKPVTVKGTITIKEGKVNVISTFQIDPHDYKVRIPESITQFYYKEMNVTVTSRLVKRKAGK